MDNVMFLRESFVKRYTQTMALALVDQLESRPIRIEKAALILRVMNDLIDDHAQSCVFAQLADSLEKISKDLVNTMNRPIMLRVEKP